MFVGLIMFANIFGVRKREEIDNERQQFESQKEEWRVQTRQAILQELQSEIDAFENNKEEWKRTTREAIFADLHVQQVDHNIKVKADLVRFEADKAQWEADIKAKLYKQLEADKLAFEEHVASTNAELDARRAQLEQEQATLVQEQAQLEKVQSSLATCTNLDKIIMLNVGGRKFACAASTLSKIPDTFLCALASDKWQGSKKPIFIDRDPELFCIVLTFLRTYGTTFDWDEFRASWTPSQAQLLEEEAKFYLSKKCMLPPLNGILLKSEHWLDIMGDQWTDRQLLFDSNKHTLTREVFTDRISCRRQTLVVVARLETGETIGSVAENVMAHIQNTLSRAYLFRTDNPMRYTEETKSRTVTRVDIAGLVQGYLWGYNYAGHSLYAGKWHDGVSQISKLGITICFSSKLVNWYINEQHNSGKTPALLTTLEVWRLSN